MADYWKSQPRKFCQYCKCWIADNKPSVDFHERGKNHKENVAAKIQEIKKKSVAKAKQEKKMSKEFAAMEEAALKAYEEDLKRLAAQPSGESLCPAPAQAPSKTEKKVKPRKAKPRPENSSSSSSSSSRTQTWVRGTTNDGQVYYYNTLTGESQWDNPGGFVDQSLLSVTGQTQEASGSAWMEAVSPDGYTYYYNTETGESSWEKPEDLSSDDISPPGVDSPAVVTVAPDDPSPPQPDDPSSPQPESKNTADPPEDPPEESPEDPTGADDSKQSGGPKISFRKRKEDASESGTGKCSDDGGSGEEKQEDSGGVTVVAVVKEDVRPVKRVRTTNPYGAWEKIQHQPDPYERVDLQLPQVEVVAQSTTIVQPEPKNRFKERSITSLGDESSADASFKKRKTENGKSRSLRQRTKDD